MLERTSDNFLVLATQLVEAACHARDGDSDAANLGARPGAGCRSLSEWRAAARRERPPHRQVQVTHAAALLRDPVGSHTPRVRR
jgi:hypothetical protein